MPRDWEQKLRVDEAWDWRWYQDHIFQCSHRIIGHWLAKIVCIAYIILYLIFFDSKQKFNEWSISAPAVPCYSFEPSGPWSNPPISIDVHARLCPYAGPTSPVPKSNIHPKSLHITTMWQRVFINIATVFNNLHHNTRHTFYAFTINTHQTTLSNIISIIIHIFTLS